MKSHDKFNMLNPSVTVDNFDVNRIALVKPETYVPLIVDANASLSLASTFQPRNGSWTGWSVRFRGVQGKARRGEAQWSFHCNELQRRPAPPELRTPPRRDVSPNG